MIGESRFPRMAEQDLTGDRESYRRGPCSAASSPAAGRVYGIREHIYVCPRCGGPLEIDVQFPPPSEASSLRKLWEVRAGSRDARDISGVWRFREMLPFEDNAPFVTLFEGNTPLYDAQRCAEYSGLVGLRLKHQGCNPTGSFKDTGMTAAVTQALVLGARTVICASTGNTAASLAAYAARAGLQAAILVPYGQISAAKLAQSMDYGAVVLELDGNFDHCMRLVRELGDDPSIYVANSINPFRIEGQTENRKPILIANDRLAIDQAGANRKLAHGHCDEREARREIVSGACNEPHSRTVAPRQDAEAIVLDFVNPTGAGRRGLGGRRQTRFDYPQAGAGTLTQRPADLIGTRAPRVESACAVMRRIIRSRDGRPCRRRLLCTPLQVRRALVWQQDRWPVQLIPSTLWLGLASNPSVRACDHVQRWPQPLISNHPIYLQIGTSLAWRRLDEARRASMLGD